MAEAFRPDGRLNIPTQAAADYIAEQGQLVPYEPTMREKTQQAIANFLRDYGGLSNFDSYNMAEGVTGSTRPDARNPMGIGLMDFTPAGLVFGGQEAARDFDKAQTATDYIAPTIGLGLSAVEAFPLTKAITKPAAAFLSNLGRKTSSDIVPTPEPLIASSGPTIPRRTFVQGAVATPVAGALSKLPLGKIDDVAPVAKAARLALPNNFSLANLSTLKEYFDDAVDLAKAEGRADDVEVLSNMDNDQFLAEVIDDDDFLDDAVNEIKEKFPNASDDEISDLLKFGDNSMDVVKNPPQSLLNRISEKDSGIYQDMIKNPSNYKIKSNSFFGERQYYFEASDGPFEGEIFAEGFATRKVEADEAKSWLKNLVKETK